MISKGGSNSGSSKSESLTFASETPNPGRLVERYVLGLGHRLECLHFAKGLKFRLWSSSAGVYEGLYGAFHG